MWCQCLSKFLTSRHSQCKKVKKLNTDINLIAWQIIQWLWLPVSYNIRRPYWSRNVLFCWRSKQCTAWIICLRSHPPLLCWWLLQSQVCTTDAGLASNNKKNSICPITVALLRHYRRQPMTLWNCRMKLEVTDMYRMEEANVEFSFHWLQSQCRVSY